MCLRILIVCCGLLVITISGCVGGPNARQGSVVGGMTGGAIGALAGSHNDKALEGAAIGALAGSTLGGVLGDQVDQDIAQTNAEREMYLTEARGSAVTIDQVIEMSASGLGDELIANQIRNNGVARSLSTQDMLTLKNNGVSDRVISAWQRTPPVGSRPAGSYRQPVVVEEHHWVDPTCPPYPPRFWCPPRRRLQRGHAGFHVHF